MADIAPASITLPLMGKIPLLIVAPIFPEIANIELVIFTLAVPVCKNLVEPDIELK